MLSLVYSLSLQLFTLLHLVKVLLNDVIIVHWVLFKVLLEILNIIYSLNLFEIHGVFDDVVRGLHYKFVAVESFQRLVLHLTLPILLELLRDALCLVLLKYMLSSHDILYSFIDLGLLIPIKGILHRLQLWIDYQ